MLTCYYSPDTSPSSCVLRRQLSSRCGVCSLQSCSPGLHLHFIPVENKDCDYPQTYLQKPPKWFYSPPVSKLSSHILSLSNKLTVLSLTSVSDPVTVTLLHYVKNCYYIEKLLLHYEMWTYLMDMLVSSVQIVSKLLGGSP